MKKVKIITIIAIIYIGLILINTQVFATSKGKTINDTTLTKERFIELVNKMDDGTLTSKNMKDIQNKIIELKKEISK